MRSKQEIDEYIKENKHDWNDPNPKKRRRNGLTIITGATPNNLYKISADEWNDVVYYIEDLEKRIEILEKHVI